MSQQTHKMEISGQTFNLTYEYEAAEAQTWDHPGSASQYFMTGVALVDSQGQNIDMTQFFEDSGMLYIFEDKLKQELSP